MGLVIGTFTEMLNCDFTTKIFNLHSCRRAHWQAYTIAAFFTSCRNSVGEKSLVVITGLISHGILTESSPCVLCYSGPLSFSFFWTTVLIKSSGHKVCQNTNSYLRTACLSGRGPFRHGWQAVTGLVALGRRGLKGCLSVKMPLSISKKSCHLCISLIDGNVTSDALQTMCTREGWLEGINDVLFRCGQTTAQNLQPQFPQ